MDKTRVINTTNSSALSNSSFRVFYHRTIFYVRTLSLTKLKISKEENKIFSKVLTCHAGVKVAISISRRQKHNRTKQVNCVRTTRLDQSIAIYKVAFCFRCCCCCVVICFFFYRCNRKK